MSGSLTGAGSVVVFCTQKQELRRYHKGHKWPADAVLVDSAWFAAQSKATIARHISKLRGERFGKPMTRSYGLQKLYEAIDLLAPVKRARRAPKRRGPIRWTLVAGRHLLTVEQERALLWSRAHGAGRLSTLVELMLSPQGEAPLVGRRNGFTKPEFLSWAMAPARMEALGQTAESLPRFAFGRLPVLERHGFITRIPR